MNASMLVGSLVERGVRFVVENDRLTVQAPRDALTDLDRADLAEHKAEVLKLLAAPVTSPAVGDPTPGILPPHWRELIAHLPHEWWSRWRSRSGEIQRGRGHVPSVEEIQAADRAAAVEVLEAIDRADAASWQAELDSDPSLRAIVERRRQPAPSPSDAAPAWPPRDPALSTWSDGWRTRWGVRSNALEAGGMLWSAAEAAAFAEVLVERISAGLPLVGSPDEAEPDRPTHPPSAGESGGGVFRNSDIGKKTKIQFWNPIHIN